MNLQTESNGSTTKDRTSGGNKSGCLLKMTSEGSTSSNSSTEKSEMSAHEDVDIINSGLVVNAAAIDQNQNCTAAEAGVVAAVTYRSTDDEDSQTLTIEQAKRPTEEELLKQLEEANRLLEADEKSYAALTAFTATPGHSRKGSESSIVSSTSSNSFYSQQNSNKVEDSNEELEPGESPPLSTKQGKSFKKIILPILRKSNTLYPRKGSNGTDHGDCSPEDIVFSGHSSESLWEIWGRIINDWDSVKKKSTFLRELVRKGIPHEFRGMAWQLILGVHDSVWKQEYAEHMKKKSPCEKLIRRDIARTFPDHDFFKEKDGFGQESLFNVMKAYSIHDREVGYCQGSGFIVGLLLMQMPEEDAFAVLVHLMQELRLRELFKPSMAELGLCMFKLECLMQELLPTLLVHFQTQNFDTSMYASSWFLTLYVTSLPLSLARRIMDLFVSEGMEMIFRVGVAILQSCQEELLTLDMEGLLKYLQKDLRSRFELEADQDNLLHTAYCIKYSHKKMKKKMSAVVHELRRTGEGPDVILKMVKIFLLEKEYTALKTKENEDQVELRRLRTENRLLRQRIDNLEKVEAKLLRQNEESSTLADKLVQDQVTWAQEVEQTYVLRNELSVLRQQLQETQKKLFEAEDIIGDIRNRTRIIEDAVHLDEAEERNMVKHLQEELIAVRLRETDTAITIKELKLKISELEDTNLRLQRAPSNDIQQLQEELIAVKLREAEGNLSLKELRMKVNEIESYWEAHMERVHQSSPKEKGTKMEIRHLQEEVMALKLKEARAVADVKDVKQRLMELETQNHICTNQIRRAGEENKDLKKQLEEAGEREKDLRTNIKDLTRKLDDTESKRKEEAMMARIKDAENIQLLAELRHRIAEIDIQKEEVLAAGQLQDKGENQELKNKLHDLQDEVLQLQLSLSNQTVRTGRCLMTDSYLGNNSDEELDAELRDSENLDRTLSDIIEGKSPLSSSRNSVRESDEMSSSRFGSFFRVSKNSSPDSSYASTSQLSEGGKFNKIVRRQTAEDTVSSQGKGVNIACDTETTSTQLSSDFAKDSKGLPKYSGESTVIADCDSAQRFNSDLKGKSCPPLRSPNLATVKYSSAVGNTNSRSPSEASHLTQDRAGRCGPEGSPYKTDISDPAHCFPESWELYEEVVEVDSNMDARVISRIFDDRDSVTGVSLRSGGGRLCSVDVSNGNRKNSIEKRLNAKPCVRSAQPSVLSNTREKSVQNSSPESTLLRKDMRKISGRSFASTEDVEDSKVDKIPDVVVIYEPSCGIGSLMCGCEETDDLDFVLKESTV